MKTLKEILLETLQSSSTNEPYALVDYPSYLNPGDAGIWLGARAVLSTLNGKAPAYSSSLKSFSAATCRARVGTGKIYFLGGGNFGDLYDRHHLARLKVIETIPDNPIVLLPLSCAWSRAVNPDLRTRTREMFARKSPVQVFTRERHSQAQMLDMIGLNSTLCPDLVHALDIVGPPASSDIQAVLRQDREAANSSTRISSVDWQQSVRLRRWNRFGKLLLWGAPSSISLSLRDWIAWRKTAIAISLVAQGRRLITDRLHAFLFGSALGRPVSLLDNSTGKVFAYHDAWTEHFPGARKAQPLDVIGYRAP
jgi:exopolysaccharide biosynthesis predicted pyruvyltransferase EpsI